MNEDKFSEIVGKLIQFKTETTRVPIKDTSWEELIWAALVYMYGDKNVEWNSQSHEKSVDIKARIDGKTYKISAKGGVIKNNILAVSSYRLTSFNSIKDKLDFIKRQHKNFDYYLICAREIHKDQIKYTVIKTSSKKFAPARMLNGNNWRKTKSYYEFSKNSDFGAKIVFKMSHQLWYSIPLSYFSKNEKIVEVSISKDKLGIGLVEFLRGGGFIKSNPRESK